MPAKGGFRVKVTKGHCLGGAGNDVRPGQVLAVPDELDPLKAMNMVKKGWGRMLPPETVAKTSSGPKKDDKVQVRDPGVEHRDPGVEKPEEPPKLKTTPKKKFGKSKKRS